MRFSLICFFHRDQRRSDSNA